MITSPDLSEELRLAVVMNGGVSLAVWIGGVTFELGRLIAGSGSYAELCSLTAAVPRVDVIAGTSAGGINGAFLAMAMANHAGPSLETQLRALRNLWVCNGSFDDLLRGPFVRDPPSLLDGDGYFLPILRDALQALRSNGPAKQELPIELFITTTLLQGRENRQSDDFGVPITDVDHRAVFHFSRDPGSGRRDDFVDPLVGDKLALAARCTSSFPAAFEPSYCPVNAEDATDTRPSMEGIADFKSGFVLDGGILDNKPLDLALERIFLQRSAGPARRMLVYVVPDPGGTAAPSIARKDIGEPPSSPGMLEIMIDSLVRIPNVQSVSAQLAALRNHNTRVRETAAGAGAPHPVQQSGVHRPAFDRTFCSLPRPAARNCRRLRHRQDRRGIDRAQRGRVCASRPA
jgi:patatin-related protein